VVAKKTARANAAAIQRQPIGSCAGFVSIDASLGWSGPDWPTDSNLSVRRSVREELQAENQPDVLALMSERTDEVIERVDLQPFSNAARVRAPPVLWSWD